MITSLLQFSYCEAKKLLLSMNWNDIDLKSDFNPNLRSCRGITATLSKHLIKSSESYPYVHIRHAYIDAFEGAHAVHPTSPIHHSGVRQEVEHRGNIWKKWEYFSFAGPNTKSSRYTIEILDECSSLCANSWILFDSSPKKILYEPTSAR